MASPKQIEANRQNSKKSTGPKGHEAKAVASQNSLKHGLFAKDTLLPWENSNDLELLERQLLSTLNPEGDLEVILVDRIVSITWRLRRAGRIESGILALTRYSDEHQKAISNAESLHRLIRIMKSPSFFEPNEEIYETQVAAAEKIVEKSKLLESELPAAGKNFSDNSQTLSLLQRYETGLERSLFKALHELQRLQAVRMGNSVPLPIAIDVTGADGSGAHT